MVPVTDRPMTSLLWQMWVAKPTLSHPVWKGERWRRLSLPGIFHVHLIVPLPQGWNITPQGLVVYLFIYFALISLASFSPDTPTNNSASVGKYRYTGWRSRLGSKGQILSPQGRIPQAVKWRGRKLLLTLNIILSSFPSACVSFFISVAPIA